MRKERGIKAEIISALQICLQAAGFA